jgi:hypothetical protein
MAMTDTTTLHPLHALYLGRSHGEVGTLGLRARLAREGAVAGQGPATVARGAGPLLAGLGLAAARVSAAHLAGKSTGGR